MKSIDEVIKGVFLLILAISGNFVAEMLGCKTQKILTENMFAKHLVTLLIIYFCIDFTFDNSEPPHTMFILSLIIYILFILFTKMNIIFTILTFIILFIIYVITGYMKYYRKLDKKKSIITNLQKIRYILYTFLLVLILTGFILYFLKQRKDYYNNWSITRFIFGVTKCKSLK